MAVEDGFSVVVVAFVVVVAADVVVASVLIVVVAVVVAVADVTAAFVVETDVVVAVVVVSASVSVSSVVISSVVVVAQVIVGIGTAVGGVLLVSKAIPPKLPLAIDCSGMAVSRQPQSRTITHNSEDKIFTPVFFIQPPSVSITIHYVL